MNGLSYLATFENESGFITVRDPYISGIAVSQEHICAGNEKYVHLGTVKPGIYYGYHRMAQDGEIQTLVIYHKDFVEHGAVSELPDDAYKIVGYVDTSLGHSVVLCDSDVWSHSQYCYFKMMKKAYYSASRTLMEIPNMPYSDAVKKSLREAMQHFCKLRIEPTGEDILKIIKDNPVWDGFRDYCEDSNQWGMEIIELLACGYTNGVPIKGGIASRSVTGDLPVYAHYNECGLVTSLAIPFYEASQAF